MVTSRLSKVHFSPVGNYVVMFHEERKLGLKYGTT